MAFAIRLTTMGTDEQRYTVDNWSSDTGPAPVVGDIWENKDDALRLRIVSRKIIHTNGHVRLECHCSQETMNPPPPSTRCAQCVRDGTNLCINCKP